MRRKLVVGNWKMNGSLGSALSLVDELLPSVTGSLVDVAVCPPLVHIPAVAGRLSESVLGLGAQHVSEFDSGAYTGEVSVSMLQELGCRYVLVGHSERRAMFGDDDERVAAKFAALTSAGLRPILCVGETLEQREAGQTLEVVCGQLDAVLSKHDFADAVLAYEPVWAIGTGKTATPEQAQEVHAALRERLAQTSGELADRTAILYGGSVNASNALELFSQADIDGGLVGGASLKADEFAAIIAAAEQ